MRKNLLRWRSTRGWSTTMICWNFALGGHSKNENSGMAKTAPVADIDWRCQRLEQGSVTKRAQVLMDDVSGALNPDVEHHPAVTEHVSRAIFAGVNAVFGPEVDDLGAPATEPIGMQRIASRDVGAVSVRREAPA